MIDLLKDPMVRRMCTHHGDDDPERIVRRLCAQLLEDAEVNTLPVDLRLLASFRGVREIEAVSMLEAGCIFAHDGHLKIQVREQDPERRQRFSIGHEIGHTFFPGFREERRTRTDGRVGTWDRALGEEFLCEVAASELIFPRSLIVSLQPEYLTMDSVVTGAEAGEATLEATALRFASLHLAPAAAVNLAPGWRVAELKEMNSVPRASFFVQMPTPVKWRVKWATSFSGMPLVPKNKSVSDQCDLTNVHELESVDFVGETGLVPGRWNTSARYVPFYNGNHLQERALVLLSQAP